MLTLPAGLMPLVIRLRGSKRRFSSAKRTMARVTAKAAKPDSYSPPRSISRAVSMTVETGSGWPVYRVSPREGTTMRAAVYFHGGAYLWEITSTHWRLIARLVEETGTTFYVPIYPLAPAATATTTVATATTITENVVERHGPNDVVLIGDSAGGGMALAVAQQLRDAGNRPNRHIVLISPWLDVGMTNPEIDVIEPTDPWLGIAGTKLAGQLYRGELPATDLRVSPLYGDMRGLAPITLFSGTRDIANADARSLVRLAEKTGIPLDYHEAPGMLHVYPLLPIAEGQRARTVIERILRSGS